MPVDCRDSVSDYVNRSGGMDGTSKIMSLVFGVEKVCHLGSAVQMNIHTLCNPIVGNSNSGTIIVQLSASDSKI
jgi:hypothetical protein